MAAFLSSLNAGLQALLGNDSGIVEFSGEIKMIFPMFGDLFNADILQAFVTGSVDTCVAKPSYSV